MTNEQYAEFYHTSVRSIQRMKSLGIDLRDPTAVTIHLVNLQQHAREPLERVVEILSSMSPETIS
jgi:hypothetical protein